MADVCTLGTGTPLNLNDRAKTFVDYGVDLGYKRTEFDEVRSYTGSIRQVDVHQPLIDVVIPMTVKGTGGTPADDLYDTLVLIKAQCIAGGTMTWQPDGEPSGQTFTIGPSSEPEIKFDELYKLRHIAKFELHLKRMP